MAKKILIVSLLPQFDIDKLISIVVLGKLLAKQDQNKVTLYPGRDGMPVGLEKVVSPQGITFLESLTGDFTSVTLNKKGSQIKNVRWEESGDKIKILIYTEQGELDTKEYAVDPGKAYYEQVISVGFTNQQALESVLDGQAGVWKSAETINIDKNPGNTKFAQQNLVYPSATTYAELVMQFASAHSITINSTEANELLSAIYWKTHAFKNEYTTPALFNAVSQLINFGANPEVASKNIFGIDDNYLESEQQIYQSAHRNGDFMFASISEELRSRLRNSLQTNPDRNPLVWINGVKASFVLSPSENQTTVYASSSDSQIKLPKIFNKYKFRGSNLQGSFRLPVPSNLAEAEIINILNGNNSAPKPAAQPAPTPTTPVAKPQQPKQKEQTVEPKAEPQATEPPKDLPTLADLKDEDPLQPAAEVFKPADDNNAAGPEISHGPVDPLPKVSEAQPQ